jgi:hypothetical protein
MKQKRLSRVFGVIAIIIATLACNVSGNANETPNLQPPAELVTIVDTPNTPNYTQVPIQHQDMPVNLPQLQSGQASDQNSSVTADENKSNGGDRFTYEQFERPFSANTMDTYFPNLDIIDTYVFQDDTWIYGTIKVVDRSSVTIGPYRFAMQLDVQLDGKGDWLILVLNPSSTDWTTYGVQVYFDQNGDVGNLNPMLSDSGGGGDGFEQKVFDQGIGDDPDGAWVRVSPNDTNTIEIAVKRSLIGNPFAFMVNMWTGHNTLDPSMFDYSDHYTHEQAGAADPVFPNFYPIKSVYELDNSCRIAVGFQPTGNEPGLCFVPVITDQPGPTGPTCAAYGAACNSAPNGCCDNIPCSGGLCRYP